MTKKKTPPFTRADYLAEARILYAAACIMDQRTSNAKLYRKLSAMLAFADANMPKGVPRRQR